MQLGLFTMEEMTRAFQQLKNDKAAGPDDFGIEIENMLRHLFT